MELPVEFENRMREMLGEEYGAFKEAFCTGESFSGLRINTLKSIPEELWGLLSGLEKVPWCTEGYYVKKDITDGKSPFHISGLFYFQEPSAMAPVAALGIEKGDYVLDLCAAPGGKATYAGALLQGEGLLLANEIIPKRSLILSENIERMGIRNAVVTNENPKRLAEKYGGFFNKIIVDAPCSGEGMFRKEPRAVSEWSIAHTESCAARQKNILDSAVAMLSPGGRLLYSTCTFAPCEDEGVADYVLTKYPDMHLLDPGMEFFEKGRAEWADAAHDMSMTRRIFPHKNKGEGHFFAVFEKDGEFLPQRCRKTEKESEGAKLFRDFEKEYLCTHLSGRFVNFGERLWLLPEGIDIDKIKTERAGLFLGRCKKGRFEPSHALVLALKPGEIKNCFETEEIAKYLRGETLSSDIKGWCAVTWHGVCMGWAKGSGGVLKNHFPKYLRQIN